MATGSSLSAADYALRTTNEKANFSRLARLLMRGGHALLREVFDATHPPATLPAVLSNPIIKKHLETLRKNRVLFFPEWERLYNSSGPGGYGQSADFDISLLCKLLREICNLTAPATGWDNMPNINDYSLQADIVRIRTYRNSIFSHNHCMEVTDANFQKLWIEISEALLRIAGHFGRARREEWKKSKSIEKFLHDPFTPDAEKCVKELQLWYREEMDLKREHEKLNKKVEQGFENLGGMVERMQSNQQQIEEKLMRIHRLCLEQFTASSGKLPIAAQVEGVHSPSESVKTRISIAPKQPPLKGTSILPASSGVGRLVRRWPPDECKNSKVKQIKFTASSGKLPITSQVEGAHSLSESVKTRISIAQEQPPLKGTSILPTSSGVGRLVRRWPPNECENCKLKQIKVSEAFKEDVDKETASRILKPEVLGTYLTRPGNSESGKSLSMRDKTEDGSSLIRHYRISFKEGIGYSLDYKKGPWFSTISRLLGHYYKNKLPNSENRLRYPYQS